MSGSADNVVQARDVSGGVHFHSLTGAAGLRPAQLPGEARGFVNRIRELQSLDAAVAALTNLADALTQDGNVLEAAEHRREAVQLLSNFSGPAAEARRGRLEALLRPE